MIQEPITIDNQFTKSKLTPYTAVIFTMVAILGLISTLCLFHPSSILAIKRDLILSGIYDSSAQTTWLIIYIIITVLNFFGSLVLAIGLLLIVFQKKSTGINFLFQSSQIALYGLKAAGVVILCIFIYKSMVYLVKCFQMNDTDGYFAIIAFALMEGLMFTLSCFLFIKLKQFLEYCTESTASMGYTILNNKITAPSIPPLFVSGFLYIAIFDMLMAFDRFFTVVQMQTQNVINFALPLASDPIQLFSGLALALAAAGNILLYIYLREYKRKSERVLSQPLKKTTK